MDEDFDDEAEDVIPEPVAKAVAAIEHAPEDDKKRKRKRKDAGDEIEDVCKGARLQATEGRGSG